MFQHGASGEVTTLMASDLLGLKFFESEVISVAAGTPAFGIIVPGIPTGWGIYGVGIVYTVGCNGAAGGTLQIGISEGVVATNDADAIVAAYTTGAVATILAGTSATLTMANTLRGTTGHSGGCPVVPANFNVTWTMVAGANTSSIKIFVAAFPFEPGQ